MILDRSGIKNYENRMSAEWNCVYFHWFCACHVRILLVFEGSAANNHLYCRSAEMRCAQDSRTTHICNPRNDELIGFRNAT